MLRSDGALGARVSQDSGAFSLTAAVVDAERLRTCIKCGLHGVEVLFKKSGGNGKRGNICRTCDTARLRMRYYENRDEIKASKREHYWTNLDDSRRRGRDRARSARGLASNRIAVAKYKKNNPEKVRAQKLVARAVRRGDLIKPDRCEAVGCCATKIAAHHDDYRRPLQVIWLCADHHERVHHRAPVPLKVPTHGRKYARAPKPAAVDASSAVAA